MGSGGAMLAGGGARLRERIGLSAGALKCVALASMLIDHTGAILVAPLLYRADGVWELYRLMRNVGRVAFPIFCFFLVEGFFHTRSVRKYGARLLAFALLSEVPFDLAFGEGWVDPGWQNVFFTLFLGLLVMSAMRWVERRIGAGEMAGGLPEGAGRALLLVVQLGIIGVGCVAALALQTDYSYHGILSIAVLYLFRSRERRGWQLLLGAITFLWEPYALLAFPLLLLYNEKRGSVPKYLFYGFYPAHLLALVGIRLLCVRAGIL